MSALGAVTSNPSVFHAAESIAEKALPHTPRFLLYNPINPWGKHREVPTAPGQTFRQWYLKNRKEQI